MKLLQNNQHQYTTSFDVFINCVRWVKLS